ncbi:hypothetical protein [Aquibacillus kalidii]|uniref:hypothetical protein n=1 Tax=Aquibacillus kalidii TaxID=2762597 RepID=UPI0016458550|nr:hypothetical protein [Aquibacillus kalidii]
MGAEIIVKRKLLTAVLSSLLFAIFILAPNDLELNGFLNVYYINFMFAVTYGVIASIVSDWLSNKASSSIYTREIIAFSLHCFFGLIFLLMSLVAAICFFIIDRVLRKLELKWRTVVIALLLVIVVFIVNII